MKKRTIKSVDDVVEALGGPSALGAALGIGSNAVSNWKTWKFIPPAWHLRIYLRLKRDGYLIKAEVFQLDEELDAVPPFRLKRHRRRSDAHVAV